MDFFKGMLNGLLLSAAIVVCVVVVFALVGCKTRYVALPSVQTERVVSTDTLRMMIRDSVIERESVYVDRWRDGDTMYIDRYHWRIVEKSTHGATERVRTDTLIRRDSVVIPLPIERSLSRWEQAQQRVGRFVIIALPIAVVLFIWWFRRKT